jgi:uncharacterized phage-associated protein
MGLHRNRIIEAIVFFSREVEHPTKMMMYKLLAELDFRHFKESGMPVTGLIYEAWKMGPVPKQLHNEITCDKDVVLPSDIAQSVFVEKEEWINESTGKKGITFTYKPKRKSNLSIFTPRQQRIMKEIVEIYKEANATDASDASHEYGTPWYNTIKRVGLKKEIDFVLDAGSKRNIEKETAEKELEEFFAVVENYGG